jgi:type IV secretory pathway VirB6-like protein
MYSGANPTTFKFTATTPAGTFLKVEENIFAFKTHWATRGVVTINTAGVVTIYTAGVVIKVVGLGPDRMNMWLSLFAQLQCNG